MRSKEYDELKAEIAALRRSLGGAVSGMSGGGGITQLTGDVAAGPGSGLQAATIVNDAVTNAKLANMAQATIKLRAAGAGTGDATDGTPDQASAILDTATDPLTRKSYVDALAVNLGKRARVRAATTANITIATALNNGDSLDGVTLATGDLVLVKNQSTAAENGVYVVGVSPVRSSEFDTYNEHPGSLIAVEEGTTNADTLWLCTSNDGGTLNTTAIAFSQLSVSAGAPSDAQYVVLALSGGLSAERRLVAGANVTITDGGANGDVTIAVPSVGGGGGGGLVLLEQHAASSSASLDFTSWYSSAYDDYLVRFIGILPATDGANLYLKVSTDGGSTWSAANYAWALMGYGTGGTQANANQGGDSASGILLMGNMENTTSTGGGSGELSLFNPGSATRAKAMTYFTNFRAADGAWYRWVGGGAWKDDTNDINGLRFIYDSGNIAEGTIRIYGIAKS